MSDKIVPRQTSLAISKHVEVDGIDMGLLEDGTPFLSARGLAAVCGVAASTILEWAPKWTPSASSGRDRRIQEILEEHGYFEDVLFHVVTEQGRRLHAFPDVVCMAIIEYYAYDAKETKDAAQRNFRALAKGGLRTFIYAKLGYDPRKAVPSAWAAYHTRLALNSSLPFGFFSVFKETSELVLTAIRRGLDVDSHTVPDGSVGIMWAKRWKEIGGDVRFGARRLHEHVYPDDFPQAKAENIEAWVYPDSAIAEFRRWLATTYLPHQFPKYLDSKVRGGSLPAATATLIVLGAQADIPPPLPSDAS